jgi:hypothetical protein
MPTHHVVACSSHPLVGLEPKRTACTTAHGRQLWIVPFLTLVCSWSRKGGREMGVRAAIRMQMSAEFLVLLAQIGDFLLELDDIPILR